MNRLQETREGANIKLASVVSDILGVIRRAILTQLIAGQTTPDLLAGLAQGTLRLTAEVLLAEIGTDISRFLSHRHLASCVWLCPGQNESPGQQRSGRTRKGSPWLRTALLEAARLAGRTQTYLGVLYRRLAARRGPRRAAIAVAPAILVTIYHILKPHPPYQDLGVGYFTTRQQSAVEAQLVKRLQRLGYEVALQPRAS